MLREVWGGLNHDVLLRIEEAEPECGRDFCDHCGDCLHCYGGDLHQLCPTGHRWIVYEDDV